MREQRAVPGILEGFLGGNKEQCCSSSKPVYKPSPQTTPACWAQMRVPMTCWLVVPVHCTRGDCTTITHFNKLDTLHCLFNSAEVAAVDVTHHFKGKITATAEQKMRQLIHRAVILNVISM